MTGNPYGEDQEPEIIAAGALTQITKGEVNMQVATAKEFPRSLKRFREEVLSMATIDKETAVECTYTIPRGGKFIVGPSIRFAELLATGWGNIREEKRSLEPEDAVVRGQGTAWDMERNRLVRAEVARRITDKNGVRYNEDMISTTSNAAASIAHRNAILACIPKALWRGIHERVQEVGAGDAKTLPENRRGWFEWWAKAGVSEARILLALRKPSLEDVGLADLGILQGLCTAYREGGLDLDQAFPTPEVPEDLPSGKHSFTKPRAAKPKPKPKPKAKPKAEPEPEPEPEPPHDEATGEVAEGPPPGAEPEPEPGPNGQKGLGW
jgi:hypothetical protein